LKNFEKPPSYEASTEIISKSLHYSLDSSTKALLKRIEDDYLYWDKVKYKPTPSGITAEDIWLVTKFERERQANPFYVGGETFHFLQTASMQKALHEIDMKYGQTLFGGLNWSESEKKQYLISSIMEEAIASSQLEGAVTTRLVAKEMLRQQRTPRNTSEQMIANNYETIQYIHSIKNELLTPARLLKIQELLTKNTLRNQEEEGKLRANDDVQVIDAVTNEIVHQPPPVEKLKKYIHDFCQFCNEDPPSYFIHPIVKASTIHFLIGYIHPFTDGNGRTARALFYWYLLQKGYWLTEYLSISSAIKDTRHQYYKAYLYTEIDDNDLTYFIKYQIKVLQESYKKLKEYLHRKQQEKREASHLLISYKLNERQVKIIQWLQEDSSKIVTVKEVEVAFSVSNQTARNDLQNLERDGWVKSAFIGSKKQIFSRSNHFDKKIKSSKGK
jgi:Fic family protein